MRVSSSFHAKDTSSSRKKVGKQRWNSNILTPFYLRVNFQNTREKNVAISTTKRSKKKKIILLHSDAENLPYGHKRIVKNSRRAWTKPN